MCSPASLFFRQLYEDIRMFVIDVQALDGIISALRGEGFSVIGPTVCDGAVVYDAIHTMKDLPRGIRDEQGPGTYRINEQAGGAFFAHVVGPTAWKRFLYPPRTRLFSARKTGKGFEIEAGQEAAPVRYAFFGVRPCELKAIALQDNVFRSGEFADKGYSERRESALIVAVNCTRPGGTCFCASMGSGPRAHEGFDLCLTEVLNDSGHHFVVEVGSERGKEILDHVPYRGADQGLVGVVDDAMKSAAGAMGRHLETSGLREILNDNFDHSHWDTIAKRCLSCANCTMVCPTCFCSTVEDVTDLSGDHAERWRRWDSCFTSDFTRVAGGNIRMSTRSRYRQWMTHKLANWVDQFGEMGCVGCGRCITWCPVGIDITAEAQMIRELSSSTTNV
jgi:sulfhydrogenase subunit beta (sulfur reductase)